MRCLAAALVLVAASFPVGAADPGPRNVVLIVADDLGLDLGCYGNPVVRTPNLDKLAGNGTRFTKAFATVASCSASRAVIYTGLFTHTNGQFGHAHPPAELHTHAAVRGLPRILRDAGYRTGIIGKLHVLPPAVYPFEVSMDGPPVGNRDVTNMGRQARKFFADSGDKPFLLVVGFGDPHRSRHGFGNEEAHAGVPETRFAPKDVRLPYFLPDQPEVRQEMAEYYQAVSRLDHGVGGILQALAETNQAERTLVIFLSDNGIAFPGAKTNLYDAGIHLPLMVSSPSQKKRGLANNAMVSWVDVTPTALDWAGVKPPFPLPGRSILPILEEINPSGWDTVFGSHVFHEITMYYPMRMLRTREHKYILNLASPLEYPSASDLYYSKTWQGILKRDGKRLGSRNVDAYLHRPREELFDLKADPNELRNVAGDAEYAGVLADLRKRLRAWQAMTRDPWIVKHTYE